MRGRLNAFFALRVNSPPMSMVNFSRLDCSETGQATGKSLRTVTAQSTRASTAMEAGAHVRI